MVQFRDYVNLSLNRHIKPCVKNVKKLMGGCLTMANKAVRYVTRLAINAALELKRLA